MYFIPWPTLSKLVTFGKDGWTWCNDISIEVSSSKNLILHEIPKILNIIITSFYEIGINATGDIL